MKKTRTKSKNGRVRKQVLFASMVLITLTLATTGYSQLTGVYPEGASGIGRNGFQVSGSYSTIFPSDALWLDDQLNRLGLGVGVGVSENMDLKFTYTRWMVSGSDYYQNAFQLASKFSSKNKRVAFYLPVSMIYSKEEGYRGEDYTQTIWAVTPRLIGTVAKTEVFDFSIIPYAEFLFEEEFAMLTGGLNLGMGFVLIPDMLTFRIEGGMDLRFTINEYPFGTLGFGICYTIGKGSRAE